MIADDSEIEWLLELYSPNVSEKFNEAHTNNDIQEMQRLIAWSLEHKFSDDWLEQVRIGFTLEDDRAVAVLTHNPDAPVKGMRLYYTKKEYEGDEFVGVKASDDPIYFNPDEEYPVNVSLYKSQSGRIDLERTESLVLPKEYYDIKEGLIPKDWWMAGFVDPYAAGIVDGAWEVLVGVYDIAKFASAYNITNSFYWTPEAFEIRENTKEFGKFLIELWKSEETRDNFKQKVKEEFGEYIDDITCLESECQYLQGKLIFDVATLFIGVGEAKAIIKGEKLTIGVVQIVKNLPKNIGKLVKVAEKTGLKIQKVGDDLIRILSKQGDEIATITDKTLKPSKFIKQGEEIGEAIDGYKLIKNGDELGFKLALNKGDLIAGKTIVDIKHGTNGKVAVIGRKMNNHVIPVAEKLKLQGKSVEIFDKNYFPDDFKFEIDGNKYTWQQIEDDFKFGNYTRDPATNYIPDSELPNTLMYKANEKWAKKLVDEGYDIIDIGYPIGETNQSVFYNMELNTIFN